ncbi:ATP-binding protein [Cellulomonas endophytica]|uniref:ATP-binding protein n=1 Tax=Cellulomonas endophytica TaxID=2494735 RepID=UPI001010E8E4|nr:ATP-binding protein [Cellulomonas endophytica]
MSPLDAPATPRPRAPLRRPERGRLVGGVAAGLAAHLGLRSAVPVRIALVALVPFAGTGLALYLFWWVTVPVADAARDAAAGGPPSLLARVAPRLAGAGAVRRWPVGDLLVGGLLVVCAVLLLQMRDGGGMRSTWLLPAMVLVLGLVLAWSQLDAVQRGRSRGGAPSPVLRLLGGVVLAGVGVLLLVGDVSGRGVEPATLVQSVIASVAVLGGVGLVLAPWWLRLVRELGDERAARARESERADIAAHLHDSVLQTLALIRARADDPTEVARMARAQERELREWLYDDRSVPGTSVAAELRAVVAEVEDTRTGPEGGAVAVDTVVVGDREPDAQTAALLQAAREALVNAVVHGRPPVSLYMEVGPRTVEVFVRDRGEGFDLADIPADRFGVRESILGRVRRRGGTATVQSTPGRGTEVHLCVPVDGAVPEAVADHAPEPAPAAAEPAGAPAPAAVPPTVPQRQEAR